MKTWIAYILLLPALISCLLIGVVPVVGVGYLSLFKSDLLHDDAWVGLQNFVDVVRDARWLSAVRASFVYATVALLLNTGSGLSLALLAYHTSKRWMGASRFLLFIPGFTAGIIIAQMWRWMVHPSGWLVVALRSIGIQFWRSAPLVMSIISLSHFSTACGGQAVIFLVMLLGISEEYKDSARLDGATNGCISRRILIPMIGTTIIVLAVMQFIGAFQMWETPRFISNGAPDGKSATLMLDVWETAFVRQRYGLACAKTLLMAALLATGLGLARLIARRNHA